MGFFDVKTAVVINSGRSDDEEYEEVTPEFCDCCGHEIIPAASEYTFPMLC